MLWTKGGPVFDEPVVTSDAGALVIRELMERSTLLKEVAGILQGNQPKRRCKNSEIKILRQRVAQICLGYFAADDSDRLRHDPAMVLAAGGVPGIDSLASQPTVSRLENGVNARMLLRIGYALVDAFIGSFAVPPPMVVLDMDPTAIEVYGEQQLALFNAKEDGYCLMPFHVYDGLTGRLITTVILPDKAPHIREIMAIVKRLARRFQAAWPRTHLVFRADSHHTKGPVMDYLDAVGVDFLTALAGNRAGERLLAHQIADALLAYDRTLTPQCLYASADYAARRWGGRQRRVVARILVGPRGANVRYIITCIRRAGASHLYETVYCGRAKAELMIKDHKRDLGGDHASCNFACANSASTCTASLTA